MSQAADALFHQLYFQTPGIAEAEFERHVRVSIRSLLYSASGDAPRRQAPGGEVGMAPRNGGFLTNLINPASLPPVANRRRRRPLRKRILRAPDFAAASTGIATSTAVGSYSRPSPALALKLTSMSCGPVSDMTVCQELGHSPWNARAPALTLQPYSSTMLPTPSDELGIQGPMG
jgi:hypothetical protein